MSVLINMDMPKNGCKDCIFINRKWHGDICPILKREVSGNVERGGFQSDCPLVEVPEPHGRLIDASEEIMVQTYDDQYEEWRQTKMTIDDLLCVGWVEAEAPTVIPAEDGET